LLGDGIDYQVAIFPETIRPPKASWEIDVEEEFYMR